MGNRITTAPRPVIMTLSFLKEKVIYDMVKLNNLDYTELKKIVGEEDVCWELIQSLELEHQNLVNISDLWRFPWLTKLEMQSNLIEKIEGLETLAHLKVLDLSFNFIKRIEGLEKLFNLTHLNLTSNKISVLENLQQLQKLEMVSVRHNEICSFNSVLHLSQLLNLYSFGIDGNPLMKENNSYLRVLSILPQLKILDFKTVTKQDLEEAFEKFPITMEKHNLSDLNSALNFKCESKIPVLCEVKVYPEDAYVDGLVNDSGFTNLIQSDKNFAVLHNFPPVWKIAEEHQNQINGVFDQWHSIGVNNYEKLCVEKSEYFEMAKEIEAQTLAIAREEEQKFINLREEVPTQLCLIYQKENAKQEEMEVTKLQLFCIKELQNSVEKLMNIQSMKIGLLLNISKTFKKTMTEIHDKYIKDIVECCNKMIVINKKCVSDLKVFYNNLPSDIMEWDTVEDKNGDMVSVDPAMKQLLQKRELIEIILELSPKIHSTLLEQKAKNLRIKLNQEVKKILDEVIIKRGYRSQDAESRNIVIFYNEQKLLLNMLFFKSNSFRHFLGYK